MEPDTDFPSEAWLARTGLVSLDDRPGAHGTGYLVRRRPERFGDGCPRNRLVLPRAAHQPHTPHSRFERRDRFLSPRQKQTVKSWKGVLGRCHAGWDEPLGVRYSDRRKQGAREEGGLRRGQASVMPIAGCWGT